MKTSEQFKDIEKITEDFMKDVAALLNSDKYASLNGTDPMLSNPSFLLSEKPKLSEDPNQVKFSIKCDFDAESQTYKNHRVQKTTTMSETLK